MPKQNLVQTWLQAIGLASDVLLTFEAAGIVDPKDLAELEISHYPALGVKEPGDRKKLFYLVQRVKMAVPEIEEGASKQESHMEWQQAGEQSFAGKKNIIEEDDGQRLDLFQSDDDDGIDKALDEQYRPLLDPSLSDDMSSDEDCSYSTSSYEEIPSPPLSSGQSLSPSKSRTSSQSRASRNKRKNFYTKGNARVERLRSESETNKNQQKQMSNTVVNDKSDKRRGLRQSVGGLFLGKKKGFSGDSSLASTSNEEGSSKKKASRKSPSDIKVRKSSVIITSSAKVLSRSGRMIDKKYLNENPKSKKTSVYTENQFLSDQASDEKVNKIDIDDIVSSDLRQIKAAQNSIRAYQKNQNETRRMSSIGLPLEIEHDTLRSTRDVKSSKSEIPEAVPRRRSKRLQDKLIIDKESHSRNYKTSSSMSGRSEWSLPGASITSAEVDGENSTKNNLMIGKPMTDTISSNRSEKELDYENETFDASFDELGWHDLPVNDKESTKEYRSKIPNPSAKPASRNATRLSTIPADRVMPIASYNVMSAKELVNTAEDTMDDDISSSLSNSSSMKSGRSRKHKSRNNGAGLSNSNVSLSKTNLDASHGGPSVSSRTESQRSRKSSMLNGGTRANCSPRSRAKSPSSKDSTQQAPMLHLEQIDSKSIESFENKGTGKSSNLKKKSVSATTSESIFIQGKPKVKSWKEQVSILRDENDQLFKNALTDYDSSYLYSDEEMRIRVIVRKRPMSRKERSKSDEVDVIHPLQYHSYGQIMVYQPKTRVDLTREVESLPFAFDNVFGEKSSNNEIYEETIKSLIPGVFDGRWASVFAYGQTGSGKTFTMMGSTLTGIKSGSRHVNHAKNFGLYYLAAQDVFLLANREEFSHLTISASLFEIYAGKLFDLLNDRTPIRCLENHEGKVCFPGLSETRVLNAEKLINVIEKGSANRSTGSTSANRDSSRSHAVLQLHLRKTVGRKANEEHGRLTFIDLAGSERGADTSQASRTTRLEGAEINTSLLALKEVIRALATGDSMTHVPFRGSKLTQVLKEGFIGKNSRTVMVACVAPNLTNCEHTLNTLRYADRVKERNSETGKLTVSVAAASKIGSNATMIKTRPGTSGGSEVRRPSKQANIPVNTIPDEPNEEDGKDDDNWLSDLDDMDGTKEYDDDLDELNEVLRSPVSDFHDTTLNKFEDDLLLSNQPSRVSKKEAVAPLVVSHRSIMTEMLSMVKQEMTLVNCTDADRALIDEYIVELEEIQKKQLSMISTLRNSLVDYYAQRPQSGANDSAFVSDASFDDLRSVGN